MIATLVVGDGRHAFLCQTISSWQSQVSNASDHLIMVNDEASEDYRVQLDTEFPEWNVIHTERSGLAGALKAGWTAALDTDCDYVLHLEEDFTFQVPVNVLDLTEILANNPLLSQVSLKRQPVNEVEAGAGGYIQCAPNAYWQRDGWIEHHVCYTFNPHLVPRDIIELCLKHPGDGLERGFTDTLLDRGYSFGIFGQIEDAPAVNHIGTQRSQNWRV